MALPSSPDDARQSARILSWGWLIAFLFLSNVGRAFYSSQAIEPSAQFELVSAWGAMALLWLVVTREGRCSRATLPVDSGFFVYLFSFVALPMLLWRTQRWRSVGKMAVLTAVWLAFYELSVLVHYALVWVQ